MHNRLYIKSIKLIVSRFRHPTAITYHCSERAYFVRPLCCTTELDASWSPLLSYLYSVNWRTEAGTMGVIGGAQACLGRHREARASQRSTRSTKREMVGRRAERSVIIILFTCPPAPLLPHPCYLNSLIVALLPGSLF